MVGNINVKDIAPNELMQHISFVFQNTKLFKTTLLENIKYGNPTATQPEVEKAVDMAQCREIIDYQRFHRRRPIHCYRYSRNDSRLGKYPLQ